MLYQAIKLSHGALSITGSPYSVCGFLRNRQLRRFILTVPDFVPTQARNRAEDCVLGGAHIPCWDIDRGAFVVLFATASSNRVFDSLR
jgi:hypothetical protein